MFRSLDAVVRDNEQDGDDHQNDAGDSGDDRVSRAAVAAAAGDRRRTRCRREISDRHDDVGGNVSD